MEYQALGLFNPLFAECLLAALAAKFSLVSVFLRIGDFAPLQEFTNTIFAAISSLVTGGLDEIASLSQVRVAACSWLCIYR